MERGNGGCQRTRTAERGLQADVRRFGEERRRHHGNPQLPHQRGYGQGTVHPRSGRKDYEGNRLQGRTALGCVQTGRHAAQADGCEQAAQPGMAPQGGNRRGYPPLV